ncbi:MAG: phosphatase PAP2 family protein [Acidobacteriota bacterium]
MVAGRIVRRTGLYRAGRDAFVANAAAALSAQLAKHLIGRRRLSLLEENVLAIGPTMRSGFDSFPSGHAATSFAVAMVLCRHRPGLRVPAAAIASLVAITRVVHRSHWCTDVAAGALLGIAVGTVSGIPVARWRDALGRAAVGVALALPLAVAIVTLPFRGVLPEPALMLAAGIVLSSRMAATQGAVSGARRAG